MRSSIRSALIAATALATLSTLSPALAGAAAPVSGIDLSAMDKSVRPQDDFANHVNGAWLKNTEIPGEYGSYGSFTILFEKTEADVRSIIEAAAANTKAKKGTEEQKIGDMFASFMDEAAIEAAGGKPIAADLARIAKVKSTDELLASWGMLSQEGLSNPIGGFIEPDFGDSTRYTVYLTQSGLTLPDREYYLDKKNENFAKIRAALPGYIEKMLTLAGETGAAKKAADIAALEDKLAEVQWAAADSRDFDKIYNPYATNKLSDVSADLNWKVILDSNGVGKEKQIVIAEKSYFAGLGKLLKEVPLDTWKAWTQYKLVDGSAPYLSKAFVDARFDFQGRTVGGRTELPPRWKRGVRVVGDSAGEAVGKLYVEKFFPASSKKRMDELVKNLRVAFDHGIDGLDWMGADTKKAAKEKLSKFTVKIGYPDKWRDYSKLDIVRGDLLGNVRRANKFENDRQLAKLGGPIDKAEWGMTPQTINAYYNPTMNEIVFPAAILQAPFFNPAADDAVNYGAIGGVIGHEISHGFDDQGSKFDGDGNKKMWWTDADRKKFEERTAKLVAQFNGFEAAGLKVNGQLTLGENIGDLSGMAVAYAAWKASLNGKEAPVIDGLTGDQRFFMGWAQVWRRKDRDEALRAQIVGDPHSPARFRIIGPMRNIEAFQNAFGVKDGEAMYLKPEDRVKIW